MVLRELKWFIHMHERHPDRFFYFYEYGMDRTWLLELTDFLRLDPERTWLDEVLSGLSIRGKYTHSAIDVEHYKKLLDEHFAEYPQVYESLHKFVEPLPVEGSTAIEEVPG
jgi:hypothetical protein